MRILLVSDEPRLASMGGPKSALKLQAALHELGHGCDVLFRDALGACPRGSRLRLALSPWLARAAVARAQRRGAYDVVDAASAEGWLLPRGAAAPVVIARSHGLEHRYFHELLNDAAAGLIHKSPLQRAYFPAVRLPQVRAALRRAARVIALNQRDREFITAQGWQPSEAVEVIPHGVSDHYIEAAPPSGAPRGGGVLYCGWWTSSKGGIYLGRAHGQLVAAGLALPLTAFGAEDPARYTSAQIEAIVRSSFGAASQPLLHVTPRTADEDAVFAAYRRHDFLVCPSTSEGFGMVVIEALSQRLPVIATSNVGAADLLRHEREALIVPPRDPEALAAAMRRLWLDPDLRRRLGDAGHELARSLTWRAVAERTLACYQRALATRAGHNRSHAAAAARG